MTETGAAVDPNASAELIAQADPADSGNAGEGRGRSGRGPGGPGGRGGAGGGRFDPSAIFNRSDANEDGKLTADEVKDAPWADRFAEVDKDNDKAVTLEEFQTGMREMFRNRNRGGGRGGSARPGQSEDNRPQRPQRPQAA